MVLTGAGFPKERFLTWIGFLKERCPGVDFSHLVGPSPWIKVDVAQGLRNSVKVNTDCLLIKEKPLEMRDSRPRGFRCWCE